MTESAVQSEQTASRDVETHACTVTQALNAAKRGLEQIRLRVIGEVSGDPKHYKAVYFSISDEKSVLPCLMWQDRYRAAGLELKTGMLVELTGRFSCYPAKGRMQFSVDAIELAGEGKLRMQVAQLARKLEAEGLMDASRKRTLQALPRRIAVVTSPKGKAVHDVLRTLRRRYPLGEVIFFGVQVEGKGAEEQIIAGLSAAASTEPAPDAILLVRGGGSYEDLMPFNDEQVARCVASCPIPVVTGIGHEPDNSICDMVADWRASTPTAAAEAVSMSIDELSEKVASARRVLQSAYEKRLQAAHHRLSRLASAAVFTDAHYLTGSYAQQIDYLGERLYRAIPDALERDAHALHDLRARLGRAAQKSTMLASRDLTGTRMRLKTAGAKLLEGPRAKLGLGAAKLDAFSPLKTLSRGYAIAYSAKEHAVVDSVEGVSSGDELALQVQDGTIKCTVDAIERQG